MSYDPERSEGVFAYKISETDYKTMIDLDVDVRKEIAFAISCDIVRNNPQLDVDVLIDQFLRRPQLGEYLRRVIKHELGSMISKESLLKHIELWESM